METIIRKVDLRDAPDLQVLNEIVLGYSFPLSETEKQLQKFLDKEDHILLAVSDDNNRILGYIHAQIYEATFSKAGLNVLALAVFPDYQGMGLGKALMAELEKIARNTNLSFIRLNSGSHRLPAHEFYKSIGYDGSKSQVRFIKFVK